MSDLDNQVTDAGTEQDDQASTAAVTQTSEPVKDDQKITESGDKATKATGLEQHIQTKYQKLIKSLEDQGISPDDVLAYKMKSAESPDAGLAEKAIRRIVREVLVEHDSTKTFETQKEDGKKSLSDFQKEFKISDDQMSEVYSRFNTAEYHNIPISRRVELIKNEALVGIVMPELVGKAAKAGERKAEERLSNAQVLGLPKDSEIQPGGEQKSQEMIEMEQMSARGGADPALSKFMPRGLG